MLETNGLDTIPVVAKSARNILMLQYFSVAVGIGIPLVIMGVLTGFHPGQSTKPERVWTMIWFVFGGIVGGVATPILKQVEHMDDQLVPMVMASLVYSVGTIGGLVTVGKMLKEYGNCIRLE